MWDSCIISSFFFYHHVHLADLGQGQKTCTPKIYQLLSGSNITSRPTRPKGGLSVLEPILPWYGNAG